MPGLYFEEFSVGQTFDHPIRRTVTETDNVLFTTMTHNPAALHLDAEYMKTTEFGRPLILGLEILVAADIIKTGTQSDARSAMTRGRLALVGSGRSADRWRERTETAGE